MLKRSLVALLTLASFTFSLAQEHGIHQPTLTPQNSGTNQLLISVSPVNSRVVWAAGTGGTYVVTTDAGKHWKAAVVPGAENLQFRDVQGVSHKVAYLMSIGNNTTDFRIYKTVDGGATWTTEFTNQTVNASAVVRCRSADQLTMPCKSQVDFRRRTTKELFIVT